MPWLGLLDELLEGMPVLAVEDWLLLEELLDEEELDWDWDEELEDDWDCDGCAGGCDWVCWLLQPAIVALSATAETRVRQPNSSSTAFRSVILSLPSCVSGAGPGFGAVFALYV